MAKRRFIVPSRADIDPERFAHPIFSRYGAFRDWFISSEWPALDALNAAMPLADRCFVRQDQILLDDGLHYEQRIAERGLIATRAENWHDLLNAAVWCRYPRIKRAINARQAGHIAEMGPARRNRAQYALTQFDEAGAVVRVRDAELLARWDRHDWVGLFSDRAEAWRDGAIAVIAVIGHALLEHALAPGIQPVGKCIVVLERGGKTGTHSEDICLDDVRREDARLEDVARAVVEGRLLNDPQELRPLPLVGIPGWHPAQDAAFYAGAASFQPARPGRVYPDALSSPE